MRKLALTLLLLVVCSVAWAAAVPVDVLWAGLRDNSGNPLEGGLVYTYTAGTVTPAGLWTAADKSAAAANPIVLDAYGRAAIYADGLYKFVVKDSEGTTLYTIDNLEYQSTLATTSLSLTSLIAQTIDTTELNAATGTITGMSIDDCVITNTTISNATFTGGFGLDSISISDATIATSDLASCTTATPTAPTEVANAGYVDASIPSADAVYQAAAAATIATAPTYTAGPGFGSLASGKKALVTINGTALVNITVAGTVGSASALGVTARIREIADPTGNYETATAAAMIFDDTVTGRHNIGFSVQFDRIPDADDVGAWEVSYAYTTTSDATMTVDILTSTTSIISGVE